VTTPRSWVSKATRPELAGKVQYHIRCGEGDVAPYCLLPGDPARVSMIATNWDESREVASYREHVTMTGRAGGVPITACSTGAGGPSTASAFEELSELGAHTFIRVGTTAAIQPDIACGDLIITEAAVRHDGTSDQYVEPAYPAAADGEVTLALIEAAERLGVSYHVGVTCCTASFYTGQGRPGFGGYRQSSMDTLVSDLQQARVLNFEMEGSTIMVMGRLFGLRTGSVLAAIANRVTDTFEYRGVEECCRVAVEAVKILARWDEVKRARGKRRWFPSLGA
jgi:uridine phosphorylase